MILLLLHLLLLLLLLILLLLLLLLLMLLLLTSVLRCCTDAVKNIVDFLGLQACERSDKVPEGKSAHTLYLAGMFRGGHDVLVRCKLAAAADGGGVTMQMTVRSTDSNVSQVIVTTIA